MLKKKVFVSGCYDLLHSGHVEFFRQAAEYGDLYVGIGSDETILHYKNHKTLYNERERLFMVKAIRYVKDAYINAGSGIMDFVRLSRVGRLCCRRGRCYGLLLQRHLLVLGCRE